MRIILVLDNNPYMFKTFSDTDQESPYSIACDLIKKILEEPNNRKKKRKIHLYRGLNLVSKKAKVEDVEDVRENTSAKSLFHFGDLFDMIEKNSPTESMLIIFTDAGLFTGSITRYPHCRTRIVITAKDAKEVDPKQLWDLEEASKRSISHKISGDEASYYLPHLYYKLLERDLIQKLYEDMYPELYYTLWNGYQSQKFRLKPSLPSERIGNVYIIGYSSAVNMVNCPVSAHLRMLVKPSKKVRTNIRHRMNKARRRKRKEKLAKKKQAKSTDENAETTGDEASPKKRKEPKAKKEKSPKKGREEKKVMDKEVEILEQPDLKIDLKPKKTKKKDEIPQKITKGKRLSDARLSKTKGKSSKKGPLKRRYQSKKPKKAPRNALFKLLYHGLKKEDMVAICRFPSGLFAAIQPLETKDGVFRMFVNLLSTGKDKPSFQPCFEKRLRSVNVKPEAAQPLHIAEKAAQLTSYDSNVANWMFNTSFNNDIQKLLRLMKRLPERKHLFYTEVNRIRNHAVLIGMYEILPVVANILRDEIKTMDSTANMHGKYVATWFEKEIIADDMMEVATL